MMRFFTIRALKALTSRVHELLRNMVQLPCIIGAASSAHVVTSSATARAEPAPDVEITPNVIQRRDASISIHVSGAPHATVHVLVLRNCDNHPATPELRWRGGCESPIRSWSIDLDPGGQWHDSLPLTKLPADVYDQPLWIRVSTDPTGRTRFGQAIFTIGTEPCSLWQTFIQLFARGPCEAGVRDTILPTRGGSEERPAMLLTVHRRARDAITGQWLVPVEVAGTLGATGVAWADARNLLVTVGPASSEASSMVDAASEAVRPGLYRIDVESGQRDMLVGSEKGETLAAPFQVRDGYLIFVRERERATHDGVMTTLAVWSHGRIVREIPLRRTIHQIIAAHPRSRSVLAYSRWKGIPRLLQINVRTGRVTDLGFSAQLFHAAMRSAGGSDTVLAIEDNAGDNGWDIVLVDAMGRLTEELSVGLGEALMPAWNSGGFELVYLGQAENRSEVP